MYFDITTMNYFISYLLSKLQSQTLKYTTKHFEDKKHFEHPVILQIT